MEGLDALGRRYGRLPSEVMGMRNRLKALSIDIWAHSWGVQRDVRLQREAEIKARKRRG